MLEAVVNDYAAYFKLDLNNNFETVQHVVDNMITRLEELTSVVQMIKLKNIDCNSLVTEDLCKYRNEIGILSKKIVTISDVVLKLLNRIEHIEKRVEKAETDFGINHDNKIKSFLKPFFNRSKDQTLSNPKSTNIQDNLIFQSVMDNFDTGKT